MSEKPDSQKLQSICLTGTCPGCQSDEDVSAIEYESDNEVWFECQLCGWNQTFNLSDAREAGYYCSYGRDEEEEEFLSSLSEGELQKFIEGTIPDPI